MSSQNINGHNNEPIVSENLATKPETGSLDGWKYSSADNRSGELSFETNEAFFVWIAGTWTVDLGRSELPDHLSVVLEADNTFTIDRDGCCSIHVPKMRVRSPLGEVAITLSLAGNLAIAGTPDPQGRFPVLISELKVTRRELDMSTLNIPFDVGFIVNPLVDLILTNLPTSTLLSIEEASDYDLIRFTSGKFYQALTRPRVKANVTDLNFLNDHGVFYVPADSEQPRFKDPGIARPTPHWRAGGAAHPASFTHGSVIHAEVTVSVLNAGRRFKLFGIDKNHLWLNFESEVVVATGAPQKLSFHGKGPIPTKIQKHETEIIWNIYFIDDGQWHFAGKSGVHRIYVTLDMPIVVNSCNIYNSMTAVRMDFVMGSLLTLDEGRFHNIDAIARSIQYAVNNYENPAASGILRRPIRGNPASTIDEAACKIPDCTWGLLDDNNGNIGNCGEATILMEQMLRLVGIEAFQCHVYASSKLEVCQQGLNISTVLPDGSSFGVGPETRYCAHHEVTESLSMSFNTSPQGNQTLSINAGEGCVMVNGGLYAGIIDASAVDENGCKAAYNMLLYLEKTYGDLENDQRICRFQLWSYDATDGSGGTYHDGCQYLYPAKERVEKAMPYGLDVPK
ncbi:hypothetical protein ACMHYB_61285 [Sorangium sp. So ce1128]